jgi:hypothetical protein
MIICDTKCFCVSLIHGTIFVMACHNFLCHEIFQIMNSHAHVCVLKKILLTYNYDYNINSHFEKNDL